MGGFMGSPPRGDGDRPGIREIAAMALELDGRSREAAAGFSGANPEILKRVSRGAPSLLLADSPDLTAGPAGTTNTLGG
jgi:hypothetical protein